MKSTLKLSLIISIFMLAALACASLTGGDSGSGDSASTGGQANILFEDDFSSPSICLTCILHHAQNTQDALSTD